MIAPDDPEPKPVHVPEFNLAIAANDVNGYSRLNRAWFNR